MEQIVKLYRLDKYNLKFGGEEDNPLIIQKTIKGIFEKNNSNQGDQFVIDDLPKVTIDGLTYYLFVQNFEQQESDWFSFFPDTLTDGIPFATQNINILLFIDNSVDVFVVVGGTAYRSIVPYIDHTFGISTISKLLKPDKDLLASVKSRGLTGITSQLDETFRDNIFVSDFARFGKVPILVNYVLNESDSRLFFGFVQRSRDEMLKIEASKSFKLKKRITFEELHKIIIELGHIQDLEESDFLSTYKRIPSIIVQQKQLNELLTRAIFEDQGRFFTDSIETFDSFSFDFCDPNNLQGFYEAEYYVLKEKTESGHTEFKQLSDRGLIYRAVLSRAIELGIQQDYFQFKVYLQGIRVLSYIGDKRITSASFLFHFTCEFKPQSPYSVKPLFLVDNKWYELNDSFISDLEQECVQILGAKKLSENIPLLSWPIQMTETDYNMLYNDIPNAMVFDVITPEGVELCDILFISDNDIFLIHVKRGFDASLRELANQVVLSSKRVYGDIKSGALSYLSKIHQQYSLKEEREPKISLPDFISLFQNKKINFVFAFVSGRISDELVEENIRKYSSNIARHSILQCNLDMQQFNYGLFFHQIMKV